MSKSAPIVDLLAIDLASGKHWQAIDPGAALGERRAEIRARHRQRWVDQQNSKLRKLRAKGKKSMPKYTAAEKLRIGLRAKGKVGMVKRDAQDRYDFMEQCIGEMVDEGSDPEDARMVCELMWDEESDLWET